jgi:hypothetical protein
MHIKLQSLVKIEKMLYPLYLHIFLKESPKSNPPIKISPLPKTLINAKTLSKPLKESFYFSINDPKIKYSTTFPYSSQNSKSRKIKIFASHPSPTNDYKYLHQILSKPYN